MAKYKERNMFIQSTRGRNEGSLNSHHQDFSFCLVTLQTWHKSENDSHFLAKAQRQSSIPFFLMKFVTLSFYYLVFCIQCVLINSCSSLHSFSLSSLRLTKHFRNKHIHLKNALSWKPKCSVELYSHQQNTVHNSSVVSKVC